MDQVLGGVVLYLNIGLTFAAIYTLVEQVSPGAFHAAAAGAAGRRCIPPTSSISAS